MHRVIICCIVVLLNACNSSDGKPGKDGIACTLKDNGNKTTTMICPDGTNFTWRNDDEISDAGIKDSFVIGEAGLSNDSSSRHDAGVLADSAISRTDSGTEDGQIRGPCFGYDPTLVVEGSYFISNSVDMRAFAGTKCIIGFLRITGEGFHNLVGLESLEVVGGHLMVDTTNDLTSFALPLLSTVKGGVGISNNSGLTTIDLPSLGSSAGFSVESNSHLLSLRIPAFAATSHFKITNNYELTSITAPLLATTGDFTLTGNYSVANVDLQNLTSTYDLHITSAHGNLSFQALTITSMFTIDNSDLELLSFPSLSTIGRNMIMQNTNMAEISFPILTTIGGAAVISSNQMAELDLPLLSSASGVTVQFNSSLTSIHLDSMISSAGSILINGNVVLEQLSISSLSSVSGSFTVSNNSSLSELNVPALSSVLSDIIISGNSTYPHCASISLCNQVNAAEGGGQSCDLTGNSDPCANHPCSGVCVEDCSRANYYDCQ